MIELQERDIEFLKALNVTGACESSFVQYYYPKRYSRNRLEKMEEEKIINRSYGLITIGQEGAAYLKSIKEKAIVLQTSSKVVQRRRAKALSLRHKLTNMKVIPSSEYKKLNHLNKGMQFIACGVTHDNTHYFIYNIQRSVTAEMKKYILKELKGNKAMISNAIIITQNKSFVQSIEKSKFDMSELLVIPDNDFYMDLLNELGKGNFDKKIINLAYPETEGAPELNKKDAKYNINGIIYINMLLNNQSLYSYLSALNTLSNMSNLKRTKVKIVCFDFLESYINTKIESIDLNALDVEVKSISKEDAF